MTNEENALVDNLSDMDDTEIAGLGIEVLCMTIRKLLAIIAKLDLRELVKPVGPKRVLRVESSLPPDPTIVVEKGRRPGRAYD